MILDDVRGMFEENLKQITKCKENNDIEGQRYFEGKNDIILTLFSKDQLFPPKSCKTWSELYKNNAFLPVKAELSENNGTCGYGPYVDSRSAIALLKIRQLIDKAYGGLPRTRDFVNDNIWIIEVVVNKNMYNCSYNYSIGIHIVEYNTEGYDIDEGVPVVPILAFTTYQYAEDFLKYGENLSLIREYFTIPNVYEFTNPVYNIAEQEYIKKHKNDKTIP